MEKQHSRILTALMVIGALSIPLAAESLSGSGSAGSSGTIGGNAGNASGSVGSNVGASVDSSAGNAGTSVDSAAGGHVDGSINGGNAGGAAGTEVNAGASGGVRPASVVDQASAGLGRSDAAVRSDFQDFSNRLDTLDRRIDENVSNNIYTFKEAAEHRADLAHLRARLRDRAGEIRRLSVAQRDRLESAIASQEKTIAVDANSDDSSDTSSQVNQNQ